LRDGRTRVTVRPYDNAHPLDAERADACHDDRPEAGAFQPALAGAMAHGHPAADPGAALREAREAQGISLEELSHVTKISVAKLMALEQNDFHALPSDVYVRGYLRAYAREVELDPEVTVQRYYEGMEAQQELIAVTVARETEREAARRSTAAVRTHPSRPAIAHDTGVATLPATRRFAPGLSSRHWVLSAVVLLVLAAVLTFTRGSGPASDVAAISVNPSAAPASTAADSAAEPAAAATPAPALLEFEVAPQGPCWISANADGEPILSRLLQAGERHRFQVRDELVLRVGDPAALTFSINGQSGRSLGRAGEPVNVHITKDNYRQFLTSQS
jgi:cytoskeleton protein RodZ